jgi:ABC-type sugar transport system substrate-binding protein
MNHLKFTRRQAFAFAAVPLFSSCNRETKKRIGVVPKGRAHMFWQSVHAGANKAARENTIEIEWNGPATETDFNGQLQIVEAMINKRLDAIALAPIDKKAMVAVVERAARQNIPVVIFDSPVDTEQFVAQVATDNYKAGQIAAERMGKGVIVVLVDLDEKEALLQAEPDVFFTTPHYDGYPAFLVRLANIDRGELEEVLTESWRRVAPKRLLKAFDAGEI